MASRRKKQRTLVLISYSLILLIFFLTLLHYHLAFGQNRFTTQQFLNNPKLLEGREKTFLGTYAGPFEDGFFLVYNKEKLPVYYAEDYAPPRFGNIEVYGKINKNGYIEAKGVHNYNYNYVWYILSFFAGIFVLALFMREWKITWRGFKSA